MHCKFLPQILLLSGILKHSILQNSRYDTELPHLKINNLYRDCLSFTATNVNMYVINLKPVHT